MQSKRRVPRIITIAITVVIILGLTAVFGEWYLAQKDYDYWQVFDHKPCVRIMYEGPSSRPKRALCLGCSFTAGVGVAPEDNYVSQLNKLIPDCSFDNCGDPGSGAFKALQHETWHLQNCKYDLVIYAMISKHLFRPPTCCLLIDDKMVVDPNPKISKTFSYTNDYPILLDGKEHKMTIRILDYHLPGSQKSRLLAFLTGLRLQSPSSTLETTMSYLIRAIYTCAHNHGAKFAVVALDDLPPITNDSQGMAPIDYFSKSKLTPNDTPFNIPALNASYPVDIMSKPELHTVESAAAGDAGDHPSAIVHKYYAERISEFIKKEHLLD